MLFNSIEFLLFLPLVFVAYWILNRWTGTRSGLQAQNLHLLPALPDIRQAFARSRCVIVPSEWDEAWCRVINEAQTWGLPVIARDVGGISEALGGAGILMPHSADAPAWARALQPVLASPDVRADMRHRGQQRVLELEASITAHIEHLESIIT